MRPIKFKAKTSDGEWVEGLYSTSTDNGETTHYIGDFNLSTPIKRSTLCQFTGLVDIDREEVYEHDIIMTEICLMVVVYVATSASFGAIPLNQFNELNDKANVSTDNMYWFDSDIVDFGIYGNIHDK